MSETPVEYDIRKEPPAKPRPVRHEISQRLAISDDRGHLTLHVGDFDGRRGWAHKINLSDKERAGLHEFTAAKEGAE